MTEQNLTNARREVVRVAVVILAFIAAFIAVRYGAYLWLENRI